MPSRLRCLGECTFERELKRDRRDFVVAYNESIHMYRMQRIRVMNMASRNVFGNASASIPLVRAQCDFALSVNGLLCPQQCERQTYFSLRNELVSRSTIRLRCSVPTSKSLDGNVDGVSCLGVWHRVCSSQQRRYLSTMNLRAESDWVCDDIAVGITISFGATVTLSGEKVASVLQLTRPRYNS
jgi:hypothetical protein